MNNDSGQKNCCRASGELSSWQLRVNNFVVILGVWVMISGYVISWSTFHQFVTNPRNITCIAPGLGQTDTVYAVAVAMYAVGQVVGTLIVAILNDYFQANVLLLMLTFGHVIGYIMYGLAEGGAEIIVARVLIGLPSGTIPLTLFYFSKVKKMYQEICEAEKRACDKNIAKKLVGWFFIAVGISYVISYGIVVLVAHLPGVVEQFRWIAWFEVFSGVVYAIVILVLFRGKYFTCSKELTSRKDSYTVSKNKDKQPYYKTNNLWKSKLKSFVLMVYLIYGACIAESSLGILESMINPILSDYFGFTTVTGSYFFLGTMVIISLSTFTVWVFNQVNVSNNFNIVFFFVIGTIGLLVLGDWQSLGGDPCREFSLPSNASLSEASLVCSSSHCLSLNNVLPPNSTEIPGSTRFYVYNSSFSSGEDSSGLSVPMSSCPQCTNSTHCKAFTLADSTLCIDTQDDTIVREHMMFLESRSGHSACFESTHSDILSLSYDAQMAIFHAQVALTKKHTVSPYAIECEAQTNSRYGCYWNQHSIITGQLCTDCSPLCRSRQTSLHFSQLCISLVLLVVHNTALKSTIYSIIVKRAPQRLLNGSVGLMSILGCISRLCTTTLGVLLYVAVGRHTAVPVAIIAVFHLPFYAGYILYFRYLSKKPAHDQQDNIPEHMHDHQDNKSKISD